MHILQVGAISPLYLYFCLLLGSVVYLCRQWNTLEIGLTGREKELDEANE